MARAAHTFRDAATARTRPDYDHPPSARTERSSWLQSVVQPRHGPELAMPGMLWCSATQYRLNPHCSTCRARSTLRRSASWVDSPIGTGQRSSAREVWAKSTVAVDPPGMSGSATSGCRHTDNRIVSSSDPAPYVPPAGEAYFPLASNAHALVAGGPIGSVRSRMKVSSLLYNRVLLESGQMVIQAGPRGSSAFRHGSRADAPASWQTPTARSRAQAVPFTLSMARETTPGVPAPGPYHPILHSETSICWLPTFEPFLSELPPQCDWIVFGRPGDLPAPFEKLRDRWKRSDDRNAALNRLVPENYVRSRLVEHVSQDLAAGAAGGWDISSRRWPARTATGRGSGMLRRNCSAASSSRRVFAGHIKPANRPGKPGKLAGCRRAHRGPAS
jgi:hypothetical protein